MKEGWRTFCVWVTSLLVIGIIAAGISFSIWYTDKTVKTPATVEQFKKAIEGLNYGISDNTLARNEKIGQTIYRQSLVATKGDTLVIFCLMYSDKFAVDRYDENYAIIVSQKCLAGTVVNKKDENYAFYSQNSQEYYWAVARVGNTLLFAQSSYDAEDDVKKIFEKLGY